MFSFRTPFVIGHRGAPVAAVENTMASFAAALDAGADGVECDIRMSADGVPVVFHDANGRRLCGSSVMIERTARARLRTLIFRDGPEYTIPTLDELLEWAGRRGAVVFIELKGEPLVGDALVDAAARSIAERGMSERAALISFSHAVVARVREQNLQIAAAPIFEFAPPVEAVPAGASAIVLPAGAVDSVVAERFAQIGLPIVCYGVDVASNARLERLGVAARIADDPGALVAR